MKKILFILAGVLFSTSSLAQINVQSNPNPTINQQNPFLDASNYVTFDSNVGKGMYFPQTNLTTWEFITSSITPGQFSTYFDGMIVYNTASGQTIADATKGGVQVSVEPGFYYFYNPGQSFPTGNINNGRWITLGAGNGTKYWAIDGNGSTVAVSRTDLADIANGDNTFSVAGKNFIGTNDATNVTMATGHGSDTSKRVARLTVGEINTVDVGGTNFDFVMEVYGKAHFTKGIVTSKSTYPDYVFDNYYTGTSDINKDYNFLSLNEVETFIKKNNHLPGVTKIDELAKQGDSYMVDTTETAMQTLEKVEELYLHVIEQQKEIKALKAEIAELKK